jgi:drug/metabolite transporter (DMT)-like permease
MAMDLAPRCERASRFIEAERIHLAVMLTILVATTCWSGNFIVGRVVHAQINPLELAFWRHALALTILAPVIVRPMWRCRRAIANNWGTLFGMGASGIILFNVGTYAALRTISTVRSVMILALAPMVILLMSRWLTHARLNRLQIIGVIISFAGIAVVEVNGAAATFMSMVRVSLGDVWMLAAMFGFALNTVLVRRLPNDIPTPVAYGVSVVIGVIGLFPGYALAADGATWLPSNGTVWACILFLAVGPSIAAYWCWFYAIRRVGPHRVGNCILLVPLFGAILGIVLLSERFTGSLAFGGVMVFGGVLLSLIETGVARQPQPARIERLRASRVPTGASAPQRRRSA